MNRAPNRPLKLFFVISLLLNLLLAGVIIGHVWWHLSDRTHDGSHEFVQNLPPAQQQEVDAVLQTIHSNTQALRRQIWAARDDAAKLLAAEPFDKTAYLAAVKHIQSLHIQMSDAISASLADDAMKLSPAERGALANSMRRMAAENDAREPMHAH